MTENELNKLYEKVKFLDKFAAEKIMNSNKSYTIKEYELNLIITNYAKINRSIPERNRLSIVQKKIFDYTLEKNALEKSINTFKKNINALNEDNDRKLIEQLSSEWFDVRKKLDELDIILNVLKKEEMVLK